MTNAPKNRKTHVVRMLGTNRAGDRLTDVWVDLERMDEAKSVFQIDESSFQGLVRKFRWLDDPQKEDFNSDGNPSRRVKKVKVCSPDEEDVNDPEEWVEVPVIARMNFHGQDQDTWQGSVQRFVNEELSEARIVESRRIFHYDTNIDDDAKAAFESDSELKMYVVPGEQYTRDEETKDDASYVEHEVIKFLKKRVNVETRSGSGNDQGKQTKLLNQYLIDESEEAKLDVKGTNDVNPPYRLDPYQNIINCQFKTGLPKYAYVWGWSDVACLRTFAVDEDTDELVVRDFPDPLGYRGYPSVVPDSSDPPAVPSPITSFVFVWRTDWKGNFQMIVGGRTLAASPTADGPLPEPAPKWMNYKGESQSGRGEVPPKGKLINGLWAQADKVSKYNENVLQWSKSFGFVNEVVSGYRVIGYGDGEDDKFGVYTLDPDDGSVTKFQIIFDGGFQNTAEETLVSWDTTTDGDIYGQTQVVLFGAGVDEGTLTQRRLIKFDLKGQEVWSKSLGSIDGAGAGGSAGGAYSDIGVAQNKRGKHFIITSDASTPEAIYWTDDHGYTYQSTDFVRVFDPDGNQVKQITWGTSYPFHLREAEDDQFYAVGSKRNDILAAGSSDRFPVSSVHDT